MSYPAPDSRVATTAVLAVALVLYAFLPRGAMMDAEIRFQDLSRLLTGHSPEGKYSMVGPAFAAPLYALGSALGDPQKWVWYFNRIVIGLGCIALWRVLPASLTSVERSRFAVAVVLLSMVPYHAMFFGGEPFTAVLVAVGLAATVGGRGWWGMPLAVLGTVNLPGTIGGLGAASLLLVARTRRLRYLLAAPVALGLCLLENYLRRGDALATGYDEDRGVRTVLPYSGLPSFSYPFFFGLLSILLSFGKGLVFFIPALFLARPRNPDRNQDDEATWLYRVWLAYAIGLVLVYARWWSWYGGWFWGPRFFLFGCFPAALVLAQRSSAATTQSTASNLLTLAVVILSTWVGISGVVFRDRGLENFLGDMQLEFVVWYVPECSGLWWPFTRPVSLVPIDYVRMASIALGGRYLAAPIIKVLADRVPKQLAAIWQAARSAGKFRL